MNGDDILTYGWYAIASNGKEYGSQLAYADGTELEHVLVMVQHNFTESLNKLHKEEGLTFHSHWIGKGPSMPRMTEEELEAMEDE